VIEDGQGNVQTEGSGLRVLVGRLCGYWSSMRHTLAAAFTLPGQQYASDGVFSENLVALMDSVSRIA
jgi:hypothetical protein